MPDAVTELLVTEAALDKLGGRSITAEEVEQVPGNAHIIVRNPRAPDPGSRRLLIGRNSGGRYLTLVIERTVDPTSWLVVTGWESTDVERNLLGS